jgi:uncharacterized UPF0160 family protein
LDISLLNSNSPLNRSRTPTAKVAGLGDYIKTVGSHLDAVVEMFDRHLREEHGRRPS